MSPFIQRFLLGMVIIAMTSPFNIATAQTSTAMFAGGCFWCMEPVFDALDGVTDTQVGYSGGEVKTANYDDVSTGKSGHIEVIQVSYDTDKISYKALVDAYWTSINPFDEQGQFADKGAQYKTYIFTNNAEEKAIADASKAALQKTFGKKKIATQIVDAKPFYKGEEYHQDYYKKNAVHYNAYKYGSGRASGLKEIWKK